MPRILPAFRYSAALFFVPLMLLAQDAPKPAPLDQRVKKLTEETDQLKHTVADQERRIAELEKTVKALEAIVNPKPQPLPPSTPSWQAASSWNMIMLGMSEADVVAILGPPSRVISNQDVRTLYYQPSPNSSLTLNGSVTLKDDRVTASSPPRF